MKHLFLLCIFIQLQLFAVEKSLLTQDTYIQWDGNLSVTVDSSGIKSSKGLLVVGSFSLIGEHYRSVELDLRQSMHLPSHDMILVRKNKTLYILDMRKEKKIGEINLPERGIVETIEIKPNDDKVTTLSYFIPAVGYTIGNKLARPGPPITKIWIYKDGKYIPETKKSPIEYGCYKFDQKSFWSDDNFIVDLRQLNDHKNPWVDVSHASNKYRYNSFYCMREDNKTVESYKCVGDCDAGRLWLHVDIESIELYSTGIRIEGPSVTEDPTDIDPELYFIESKVKVFTKGIEISCPKPRVWE